MKEYVDFKIITTKGEIIQEGYVDTTTLDDDEPTLMWYTEEGFENAQPRNNPYHDWDSEGFQLWEDTMVNWITDDQFFQFIHDFADENKTFKRDGYVLVINDGEIND